jgi:hypothetical protein
MDVEGVLSMKVGPALRRLGATVPFFALAAVVLGLMTRPVVPPSPPPERASTFLIVTTENLSPAFRALDGWNRSQGCATRVVSLADTTGGEEAGDAVAWLGSFCALRGASGLLLGGDENLVPFLPEPPVPGAHSAPTPAPRFAPGLITIPCPPGEGLPPGLRVGRAPVRTLREAWAFVEACRANGRTVDRLLDPGTVSTASAGGGTIRLPVFASTGVTAEAPAFP